MTKEEEEEFKEPFERFLEDINLTNLKGKMRKVFFKRFVENSLKEREKRQKENLSNNLTDD